MANNPRKDFTGRCEAHGCINLSAVHIHSSFKARVFFVLNLALTYLAAVIVKVMAIGTGSLQTTLLMI
jgi:hypothetical protein